MRGRKLKNPQLPPRWGLLSLYACLAGLSHILLDFTNNYGVRPLWPFSERWFSWDIVFIVEPLILLFLLAGLLLPSFFSLINEEIGSRSRGLKGRLAATLALVGVVLIWGVRDFEHRRAVSALQSRLYRGAEPVRASAYPYWVNPFRWSGVVETRDFFAVVPVDSFTPEVDREDRMSIHIKPEETPATLAAKKSYLGRVYLDWAQYPIAEVEHRPDSEAAYIVSFHDLRYEYAGLGRRPLSSGVELDKNLLPIAEIFGTQVRRLDSGK